MYSATSLKRVVISSVPIDCHVSDSAQSGKECGSSWKHRVGKREVKGTHRSYIRHAAATRDLRASLAPNRVFTAEDIAIDEFWRVIFAKAYTSYTCNTSETSVA